MTTVRTADEIRGLISRLVRSWDRERGRGFNMKIEYAKAAGPMIWSLTHHTTRLSKTICDLSRTDDMLVAVPLIRLCIDNAMTAAWLAVDQQAAEALIHEGLRQRKNAVDGLVKAGAEGFDADELKKAADELDRFEPRKLAEGQHVEPRMKAIKNGQQSYSLYRIASSFSHAGMTLADSYLQAIPASADAPLGLALAPDNKLDHVEAWLGTTASMLTLAMSAYNMIDADGRQKSQVDRAAKQIGMGTKIELARATAPADDA
jgi:hypothetical protein